MLYGVITRECCSQESKTNTDTETGVVDNTSINREELKGSLPPSCSTVSLLKQLT